MAPTLSASSSGSSLLNLPSVSFIARTLLPILIFNCHWFGDVQADNHPPKVILTTAVAAPGAKPGMMTSSELTMVRSLLGLVEVNDTDPGQAGVVTCTIESNFVGLEPMSINHYKLLLVKSLDYELTPMEDVRVTCTDNGSPPMSTEARFSIAITDENDNIPVFSKKVFEFNLMENSPVGTMVGVAHATDLDHGENGEIEYVLENEEGEISSMFDIGVVGGNISSKAVFDREETSEIRMYAFATDHGSPSMIGEAQVIIHITDQNDNYPSITSSEFSIMEELPSMSLVGVISAEDIDAGPNAEIEFSLVKEDDDQGMTPPFIVKADGSVFAAVSLDREMREKYVLKVSASDNGSPPLSNTSIINIIVVDKNDNPPVIVSPSYDNDPDNFNSSEAISVDWTSPNDKREVFQVVAYDIDTKDNARLSYTIEAINKKPVDEDSLFRIDKTTGQVFLQRGVRANDEPAQVLSLLVYDGGKPSLSARAWLNVSLDVDFSNLPSQPIMTKTTQASGRGGSVGRTGGGNNASSHVTSSSIVFHLYLMFVLIFRRVICSLSLL